jgi:hypothetical protein
MRSLVLLLLTTPAIAFSHPGAQPGEAFTFKFSVGPIESGRARMSVGLPVEKNGKRLVAVHGQAETLPWLALVARMNDDYQLVLDANTLVPLTVSTVERGMRERKIDTSLEGRLVNLELSSKKESGRTRRMLPAVARDPLSALFAVRAAKLEDGDSLRFLIIDGLALWHTTIDVHRQPVRLENETRARRAIRLDGTNLRVDDAGHPTGLPPRHYTLWLSDDTDRVLLRMEADTDFGKASIELTSYQQARTRAPAPTLPGVQIAR